MSLKVYDYALLYGKDYFATSPYEDYYAIVWPTVAVKIDLIVNFFESHDSVEVISSEEATLSGDNFEIFMEKVYAVDGSISSYEKRLDKIEELTCSHKIVMLSIRFFKEIKDSNGFRCTLSELELSEFVLKTKYSCRDLIKKEIAVSNSIIIHMEHMLLLNRRLGRIQKQIKIFQITGGGCVDEYLCGIEDLSRSRCCVIS